MMLLLTYLLKVILCSGILFLYYHLALRNKLFHQWNRFYLLAAALLSVVIPVVQITITHRAEASDSIRLLKVVDSANSYLEEVTVGAGSMTDPSQWGIIGYGVVSGLLLLSLLLSITRIVALARQHTPKRIMDILFFSTRVPGTPFSFFRYIFWNEAIDLQSETGQQIFEHEMVHVKEKHSLDKLFMQLLLVVFWCNPFFWLMRRELKMIHEFIADKKAVGEEGAAAFAAMVLQASYSTHMHSITNQFFQTSIKRRLLMIRKIQNPKLNYVSRIIALPLIAVVALAFGLRSKALPVIELQQPFTVVIDAGHGVMPDGKYSGARVDGVAEDDLVLKIATLVKEQNVNNKLQVVLTRASKDNIDLKGRVAVAEKAKADLFLSLHLDAMPADANGQPLAGSDKGNGFGIMVSRKEPPYHQQSELFGSVLQQELKTVYKTAPEFLKRQTGIWVLDKNVCPSVMLDCGFLTNSADRQFITNEENQKTVARKILAAIERYAKLKETGTTAVLPAATVDTVPQPTFKPEDIKSVDVNKAAGTIAVTLKDGTKVNYTKEEAEKHGLMKAETNKEVTVKEQPLYYVDGEAFKGDLKTIDPNTIESINVLKGASAVAKYGEKGKNGVVEIMLKKTSSTTATDANIVFEKTEQGASIKSDDWRKFLVENLQPVINEVSKTAPAGQYTAQLRFIVETDGTLSNAVVLKDPGYGIGPKLKDLIYKSPKWEPAVQNGYKVRSYHIQPITLVISESKNDSKTSG